MTFYFAFRWKHLVLCFLVPFVISVNMTFYFAFKWKYLMLCFLVSLVISIHIFLASL